MAVKTPEARRDCERAEALYMTGLPPSEIAQRLGIKYNKLRLWCQRGKWTERKRQMQQGHAALLDKTVAMTLADNVLHHQKRVAQVYEGKIDSLSKFNPVEAKEFVEVSQALKNFDDVGRRNLGLSDESDSKNKSATFHFNLCKKNFQPIEQAKIIEIASDPGQDKSQQTEPKDDDFK